ncbi:MAG: PilZ domain-containing protein [Acidothermus cellulolyticus]|nr:PilZ domain-containing protein [Acidothermus cellulolyticus]MCL6551329.1 PilZ domain-containing protein [Acidothermus cellulolyticus]
MSRAGADTLSLNALVTLRIGDDEVDYPSRIEDIAEDSVFVAAPTGGSASLVASGVRTVELSWVSPRGRYQQPCEVVEFISGQPRLWRLRPTGPAALIQRRRFVRVRAAVPVLLVLPGTVTSGTTIDISEGGFRMRIPRQTVRELVPATIQTTIGGVQLEIHGHVIRTGVTEVGQTEVVVAFDADMRTADAIRRFVFHVQLRARAVAGR